MERVSNRHINIVSQKYPFGRRTALLKLVERKSFVSQQSDKISVVLIGKVCCQSNTLLNFSRPQGVVIYSRLR